MHMPAHALTHHGLRVGVRGQRVGGSSSFLLPCREVPGTKHRLPSLAGSTFSRHAIFFSYLNIYYLFMFPVSKLFLNNCSHSGLSVLDGTSSFESGYRI